MKVFDKSQEKEFKKIADYIVSKDPEISKMGVQLLRKSNIYRKLRSNSLFYYPSKSPVDKTRLSTFINQNVSILLSEQFLSTSDRNIISRRLHQMFERLMSKDVYQYFRREFINTAKIL